MKVKDLKKFLENCDDEAIVVVPGYDHSYRAADPSKDFAGARPYGKGKLDTYEMSEWYDAEANEGEVKVKVIVFGR